MGHQPLTFSPLNLRPETFDRDNFNKSGSLMPPIRPHYSRPLDVHRWSDHPEVNELVREVWDHYFGGDEGKRSGPKPKARLRDMLKACCLQRTAALSPKGRMLH